MKKTFILMAFVLALFSLDAQTVNNLYVSPTGWAMWEGSFSSCKVYLDEQMVAENVTDNFFQLENLTDGQEYITTVIPVDADGTEGESAEYAWTKKSCDMYGGVTNFNAALINNVAMLSWTLPAIYKDSEEPAKDGNWLHYDNGTYSSNIGLTFDFVTFETFQWGIMFPASDMAQYANQNITKVSLYDCEAFDGEVFIYEGGSSEPGTLLYSQEFTTTGSASYFEVELNTAVEISGNQNVWIVMTNHTGDQPAAVCADQGNPNARWICYDEFGWLDNMMVMMPPVTWMIRAYITDEEIIDPVITETLGAILYRNGELISELITEESYIDAEAKDGDEYSLRVVYGGELDSVHYAMSCPQTVVVHGVSVDENDENNVMIYPNPTNGSLNVKVDGMCRISVVNTLGQVVCHREVDADSEIVDLKQFGSGIYMIRVETQDGIVVRRITVTE